MIVHIYYTHNYRVRKHEVDYPKAYVEFLKAIYYKQMKYIVSLWFPPWFPAIRDMK